MPEPRTEPKHIPACCGGCDECFRVCWGYHGPERRKAERRIPDEDWNAQLPAATPPPDTLPTREQLAAALHQVYCREGAPMHSAPDHSAGRILEAALRSLASALTAREEPPA